MLVDTVGMMQYLFCALPPDGRCVELVECSCWIYRQNHNQSDGPRMDLVLHQIEVVDDGKLLCPCCNVHFKCSTTT
jgi:hypothetical protein